MTPDEYMREVERTASSDATALRARLAGERVTMLLHAALGLSTESGEFVDVVKRSLFYGVPLDTANAKE